MEIILIAAVSADGLIAKDKNDPVDWSLDRQLFRKQTLGHTVLLGQRTFSLLKRGLDGRKLVIVKKGDKPKQLLDKIEEDKCFVAGGAFTNTLFLPFLTHLFLTPHPYIFGAGIPLFNKTDRAIKMDLIKTVPISQNSKILQFQYKIKL